MAKEVRTPKEIVRWSGKSLRAAQKIVQRVFPVGVVHFLENGDKNQGIDRVVVKKREKQKNTRI